MEIINNTFSGSVVQCLNKSVVFVIVSAPAGRGTTNFKTEFYTLVRLSMKYKNTLCCIVKGSENITGNKQWQSDLFDTMFYIELTLCSQAVITLCIQSSLLYLQAHASDYENNHYKYSVVTIIVLNAITCDSSEFPFHPLTAECIFK